MKDNILILRSQGYSYNEIVSKLSCSKSTDVLIVIQKYII